MTGIRTTGRARGRVLAVLMMAAALSVTVVVPVAAQDQDESTEAVGEPDGAAEEPSVEEIDPEAVDDWGRDPDSLSGTIEQVCGPGPNHDTAEQRPGRMALIDWLDETFPEIEGFSGFVCREIHNRRSSCPGRMRPRQSSCWSTHAAGRAIDVMVGGAPNQDGRPVGKAVGDRVVNTLLATVAGVPNYRARTMGVQQLLWDGRCWSTREHADAGITDINTLGDDCIDGHDNHVHITLSEAGADGRTSFHLGGAVTDVVAEASGDPRDAHLLAYNAEKGRLLLRGVGPDGTFTDREASEDFDGGWSALATPDVGGNGNDELFAYDRAEGRYVLREIRADGALGGELGGDEPLEPGWSLVASPDVDGDGDDELFFYRGDDGRWALYELDEDGALGRQLQADGAMIDVFFSGVATPDVDGDGDDELLVYRQFDGHHLLLDFADVDEVTAAEERAVEQGTEDGDADGSAATVPAGPPVVPAPGVLDGDEDGDVDVTVDLAAVAPLFVDEAGLVVDPAEVDDPAPARAGGLGGALTAGFTTVAAVDVDADAIDELALYRAGDGCLALRDLQRPVMVADEDASADAAEAESDEDGAGEAAGEPVQPCLTVAGEEDAQDGDRQDDGEDVEAGAMQALDPQTWLLESRDALEPGWSVLMGAAVD